MKTCFKCGESKPLDDFYRHPKMADGHLNKCKACSKSDVSQHRHGAGRDRVLAYDVARAKTPKRIANRAVVVSRWEQAYPERKRAQAAVRRAVRRGDLQPWPACSLPDGCDATKVVAHHTDYSRPLTVVWLCQAHHKQAHAMFSQLINH